MSQPNGKNPLPDLSGQSKIMFYNEGNPNALMVTNQGGRRKSTSMAFATAEAALDWCRSNASMLVYFPLNLAGN